MTNSRRLRWMVIYVPRIQEDVQYVLIRWSRKSVRNIVNACSPTYTLTSLPFPFNSLLFPSLLFSSSSFHSFYIALVLTWHTWTAIMSRHTMTQLSAKEGELDCTATTGLLIVSQVAVEAWLLHDLNSQTSPSTSMRMKSTIFRVDTPVPLDLNRQDQRHTISKENMCLGCRAGGSDLTLCSSE